MTVKIIQINLQTEFGGGEVYTQFLTRALQNAQIPTQIIVNKKARFWQKLNLPSDCFIHINNIKDLPKILANEPQFILSHGPLPISITAQLNHHFLVAIAHMPLTGRNPLPYKPYNAIIPVSHYVLATLKQAGFNNVTDEPLYGIANPEIVNAKTRAIYKKSCYSWDKRKGRDILLSYLEPLYTHFAKKILLHRRPGITLGIVSRITTIKQFPLLFQYIAPVIAEFPKINLEIIGAGGYASVRDLKKALSPITKQTRFWGQQSSVGTIYRECDYILSGLPEREALGLNLLEAQACNTPVIAINAPPFIETVHPNVSGLLYTDPRLDNAKNFRELLITITENPPQLNPKESPHLEKFTMDYFQKTLYSIVQNLIDKYRQFSESSS